MPALRDYVGTRAWDDAEVVVTEQAIRRYAEAVGEPALRSTPDGRLIAPPMFLPPFAYGGPVSQDGRRHKPGEPDILPFTAAHRVMGECVVDFVAPIVAGERIRSATVIADIYDKRGRSGPMLFVTTETEYATVDGAVKRRERWTIICPGATMASAP
jgi:hydroxyacyl-ACP dehydratase HTD2-like protein with hotdog domain